MYALVAKISRALHSSQYLYRLDKSKIKSTPYGSAFNFCYNINMKVSNYKDHVFLKNYEQGLIAKMLINFREIKKLIKPIKGKVIVDLGCGNGILSKDLYNLGAKVIAVDLSEEWIKICKNNYKESERLSFKLSSAEDVSFIKTKSVDVVILNMVLLNVDTLKKVESIFKEVGRILKKGGIFIFSDLHPITKMSYRLPPDRYVRHSKEFSYFKNDSEFVAGIRSKGFVKGKIEFLNKHWTLETYSDLLVKNGLFIYKISEPTYGKNDPEILQTYKVPEFILFGCRKL